MQLVQENMPVLGNGFSEILQELHAHVFEGVPGESDPFVLSMLEREYIAYVLALYYQCEHCRVYHGRAIDRIRRKGDFPKWSWNEEMVKVSLFLRAERRYLSDVEINIRSNKPRFSATPLIFLT